MTKNFQTIVFARKHSLVQKTGETNITTLVLFPPGFLIIQYYFLGKICIGKVELLSYKKSIYRYCSTIILGWSRTYMLDNFKHYYIYVFVCFIA